MFRELALGAAGAAVLFVAASSAHVTLEKSGSAGRRALQGGAARARMAARAPPPLRYASAFPKE